MTAMSVDALEAELPTLVKAGTVWHAYHKNGGYEDVNELYADAETAKSVSAVIYAQEEYGGALVPAGALEWRWDAPFWELFDQGSNTGITVQQQNVFVPATAKASA